MWVGAYLCVCVSHTVCVHLCVRCVSVNVLLSIYLVLLGGNLVRQSYTSQTDISAKRNITEHKMKYLVICQILNNCIDQAFSLNFHSHDLYNIYIPPFFVCRLSLKNAAVLMPSASCPPFRCTSV